MAERPDISYGDNPHRQSFDEDETLVQDPVPVNDFSELEEEDDETPTERRRDPLRHKF